MIHTCLYKKCICDGFPHFQRAWKSQIQQAKRTIGSRGPKGPKESHPPAIEHYPCKHAHVRHFLTHCHMSITHVSPLQLPTRSSLERRRHTAIEQKRVYEWSPLSNGRPFPRSPGTTCRGTSATQRARCTATTALKTLHSNRGPGAQQPQPGTPR